MAWGNDCKSQPRDGPDRRYRFWGQGLVYGFCRSALYHFWINVVSAVDING